MPSVLNFYNLECLGHLSSDSTWLCVCWLVLQWAWIACLCRLPPNARLLVKLNLLTFCFATKCKMENIRPGMWFANYYLGSRGLYSCGGTLCLQKEALSESWSCLELQLLIKLFKASKGQGVEYPNTFEAKNTSRIPSTSVPIPKSTKHKQAGRSHKWPIKLTYERKVNYPLTQLSF